MSEPSWYKSLIQKVQFAIFVALERAVSLLPLSWVYILGEGLGFLCYYLFVKRRGLVARNLDIAFPHLSSEKGAVRKVFASVGANLLSSLRIGAMEASQLQKYYHWVENDVYQEAVKADHPRMVLLGHVSNWELLSRAVSLSTLKTGALYRSLDNVYLDSLVKKRREKDGMELFSKKRGLLKAIRLLEDNGLLGLLIDQHVKKASVSVDVFGQSAQLSRMPQMILDKVHKGDEKAGVQVYYLCVKTVEKGRWQLEFKKGQVVGLVDLGEAIETFYRYAPEEVFFFHRLWR